MNYQKHLSGTILKYNSSENFLQINTSASVVEFIFHKTPCFQYILMNNFRLMCLKYENFPLRGILFSIVKQHSDDKSLIAKTFNGNTLKRKTVSPIYNHLQNIFEIY